MAPGWFPPMACGGLGAWWRNAGVACYRGSGAARRSQCGPRAVLAPSLLSLFFWGVGAGLVCGWVGCELHSGREHQMRPCGLACPGCGVVCVISFVSLIVFAGVFVVFAWILFVVFVCFYGRSVDALASGADEGRGGLR